MAMASRAPQPIYRRQRNVVPHAVMRLRERLRTSSVAHRPDFDLGNLLDEAVSNGIATGKVEEVSDQGESVMIIDIADSFDGDTEDGLYAVVKENTYAGSGHQEAVITLLTDEQVSRSRNGRWNTRPFNGAFAELSRFIVDPPPTTSTAATEETEADAPFLLTYEQSGGQRVERLAMAEVKPRFQELASKPSIDAASIAVWRHVPVKVCTEIKVEVAF